MRPEIKFCGMTRRADVDAAVALGARYVGVIFAKGPRTLSVDDAREVLRNVPPSVGRVGVFGRGTDAAEVARVASGVSLDVVQLHGDPNEAAVSEVRRAFGGAVWAAVRVSGESLPEGAGALFDLADAVVLDAYSPKALGGTGVALPWRALRDPLSSLRGRARVVLAGGLRPDNVAAALRELRPDVVDVSSGVESAPGVKDHAQLRAFRDAVWAEVVRT